MKLSKLAAHNRTMKSWESRNRRRPPSHWERPNGEKVALKGFSAEEYHQIKPALNRTDSLLKKRVNVNIKSIEKKKFHRSESSQYGHYITPGLLSRKGKIEVNSRKFRGTDPGGVLAHEIGHAISPGANRDTSMRQYRDFRGSFDYKKAKGARDVHVERYISKRSNPVRNAHNRQSVNAMEDFAETYRAYTGHEIAKGSHFKPVVNKKRDKHFKRYYLK